MQSQEFFGREPIVEPEGSGMKAEATSEKAKVGAGRGTGPLGKVASGAATGASVIFGLINAWGLSQCISGEVGTYSIGPGGGIICNPEKLNEGDKFEDLYGNIGTVRINKDGKKFIAWSHLGA